MNKTQQKAVRYAQLINDLVENLEKNQSDLNPDFEKLKAAIQQDTVKDIPADDYWQIQEHFQQGTNNYQADLEKLQHGQAPARLVGTHHLLLHAYEDFVAGCQQMVDSMLDDRTIDTKAFDTAEQAQDAATEKIGKYIQKLTQLI
ncbi:hypothetical protein ACNAN0_10940 [Agrilactobacillus fermenti]|uniref:hypothetical protein n=1 Tax=Agrilactobacillus fermenti TaxID=2586909 RepID=UPI003A5BDD31